MNSEVIIELTKSAERDLKDLWKVSEEVVEHLKVLITDPKKGHLLAGNLQGVRSLEFVLKGSGQYRAAYIFKDFKVTIFMIGSHENFYKQAHKRAAQVRGLMTQARKELIEKSQKKK